MSEVIWIFISYLLGSIPFGYLISKLSGKNVLEIGWKKTSGSNVFKNVGKWQGVLTALFDVAKGYLAVYAAQRFGLSLEIQVFSGVAAVTGHNWSLFLHFAGGRGIGTFAGAFLALAPQVLLLSIIPLALFALIWNAAVGTLLSLAAAIFLSVYYFKQFEPAGLFTVISLAPILIKRLSPISEIKTAQNKFELIRNRLLFDNNKALLDLRIKRIKPLAGPIKYGVKMARKPIDMLLRNLEKVVTKIGTEDFKKMMVAASKKIVLHQEEINRINVFPVADKDTGYNLAATLLGVEGTISRKDYKNIRDLTEDIKTAAMINARGNAGMICTGYFIEVLDRIKHLEVIDAFHLALAMKRGIKAAKESIAEPVEGTILDVIKAAGETAFNTAKVKKEKNIIKVLEEAYKVSEVALRETKEKLQVLKENNVVDAGALGFLKILEAWIENLKGIEPASKAEVAFPVFSSETAEELKFRYEIVFSFKKREGTEIAKIREELSSLGDSLEIIESNNIVKIHIHTNQPEDVRQRFEGFPEFKSRVEELSCSSSPFAAARAIEDMGAKPRQGLGLMGDEPEDSSSLKPRRPLGLIVDEVADLPKEILEKYRITEVPFTTRFPDGEIVKSREEIYPKMKEALKLGKPLPTTSAPTFKDFFSTYQRALENFEKILVITVSSKLSGTYSSARIARSIFKKPKKLDVYVFDCNTAEVAEGLIAARAGELISRGKGTEEIVEYLKVFCPKVTLVACVNDFRYVVRGGRVRLPKIFIGPLSFIQRMGIRFLVGLKAGKVKFFGATLGKDVARILSEEIQKQRKGKKIRVAIAHADAKRVAEKLKSDLEKKPGTEVLFVSPVSPVVGTHTGPGAVLAAFHPIDEDI